MKKMTVTTYDAFGRIAKKYKADHVAWYDQGPCIIDKVTVMMPAIVVEEKIDTSMPESALILNPNPAIIDKHEITLLSFNNKVIRKWVSLSRPAFRHKWCMFDDCKNKIQITGSVIIKSLDRS